MSSISVVRKEYVNAGSQRRITAPKVEAKLLYTNKAGKLSLQSQMGLQDDCSQLDAMTVAKESTFKNLHVKKGQNPKKRLASKSTGSTSKERPAAISQLASAGKSAPPGPSCDSAAFMTRHATKDTSWGQVQGSKRSLVVHILTRLGRSKT
ncbi:hypothetical protein C8T65DRAFT_693982 [Cerioporus squamosus]|nr:hypothetical protein C8T65DRAFT_693982 [Cerioporus squamosus]